VEQLQTLGAQIDVPVFTGSEAPPTLAANAVRHAASIGQTLVILDTAGRLQIDDEMMAEVAAIKQRTQPAEVLLVADAMVGQEAVRIADGFHKQVGLTGLILTKMDGDARGGAAISMRSVTGVPIKLLGVGEKLEDLEVFSPERLSGRILGMGDVVGLIEKAEAAYDEEQAQQKQSREHAGKEDLADRSLSEQPPNDHEHARRNQHAQTARPGDRAERKTVVIAEALHLGVSDTGERCSGRDAHASDEGEDGIAEQCRNGQAARKPP